MEYAIDEGRDKTNGEQAEGVICPQGMLFFLIIRPDQEKYKNPLSVLIKLPRKSKSDKLTTSLEHYYPWRENMQDLLNRITFNKDVLCGKPLIRGLRISVEMILELLAKGSTEDEILEDFPQLEPDDLRTALLYAHHMVAREDIFDRVAAG